MSPRFRWLVLIIVLGTTLYADEREFGGSFQELRPEQQRIVHILDGAFYEVKYDLDQSSSRGWRDLDRSTDAYEPTGLRRPETYASDLRSPVQVVARTTP